MKKVTTLATRRQVQDARHLMRYLRFKASGDMAAIAKSERVSVETVRQSVAQIERLEAMNQDDQVKLSVNGLIRNLVPQAEVTINGLLNATTIMSLKNKKTGMMEDVLVEDKTTRLEAGRLVKDLIVAVQPKAPPVSVSVSQTNQVAQIGSSETTEERFARLRQKAAEHNLLPAEVAGVPVSIDQKGDSEDDDDSEEESDGEEEDEE
jgi:hypothetical protein